MLQTHIKYMQSAIKLARRAYAKDCVPVGCILVYQDKIISRAHNGEFWHAEILCIQKAQKKLGKYLNETTMFVTVQPCQMCMHAIRLARIACVVCGANNDVEALPIVPIIDGICQAESSNLMQDFFKKKRLTRS